MDTSFSAETDVPDVESLGENVGSTPSEGVVVCVTRHQLVLVAESRLEAGDAQRHQMHLQMPKIKIVDPVLRGKGNWISVAVSMGKGEDIVATRHS